MKDPHTTPLGTLLKNARKQQSISARELGRRAGVTDSNIVRIEQGQIASPRPDMLKSIADALDIDLADVYAAAGYVQPQGLPSFTPYLRSKYADLPAGAKRELEKSFDQIAKKYGYDQQGPKPGQDES